MLSNHLKLDHATKLIPSIKPKTFKVYLFVIENLYTKWI